MKHAQEEDVLLGMGLADIESGCRASGAVEHRLRRLQTRKGLDHAAYEYEV